MAEDISILSDAHQASFWPTYFSHPYPNYTGRSDISKFGVILDFGALQFRNEATYLTPNTNYGIIDGEGHMSSKNLV